MPPVRLVAVSNPEIPDETLMMNYRDGDAGAFEHLYSRHRGGVFRFVLRQLGQRSVAEEVFQETWMRIIAARARYRVEAKFTTFLYHVARNCVIDHVRSRPALHLVSLDSDEDPPPEPAAPAREQPDQLATTRQLGRVLSQAIALLPVEQREAFLLQQEGGLSLEEIAEVTGAGRETVKSRLRYALEKLRDSLRGVADAA
ncbi:MAG: RNA polymerase sigma factor [Burkholderiales bacterium]